jgi:hypothetical protein
MSHNINANASMDENSTYPFQTDTLLSDQYFESFRRKTYLEPEKNLMLAVMEDGLLCFQQHLSASTARKKRLFREAEEWIFDEEDRDWLFSFENICAVLGLSRQHIRRQLSRRRYLKQAENSKARMHRLILRERRNKRWGNGTGNQRAS